MGEGDALPNGRDKFLLAYLEDKFRSLDRRLDGFDGRLAALETAQAFSEGQRSQRSGTVHFLRDWLGWLTAVALVAVRVWSGLWSHH